MRRTAPAELTEADYAALESAAKQVASRYRGYVDFNDLIQECFVWLLENYRKVEGWRDEYSDKHAERMLVRSLKNACERYARKEKAEFDGYSVDDEFHYSLPVVANMLRLYFDPDRFATPSISLGQHVSGGAPASEGGNLMTMVADVGRVYEQMPMHDRVLLHSVYAGGDPKDNIQALAEEWGTSWDGANGRVRRVVGRLREKLGGPNPWNEEK
jgi:hypothetical protein